MEKLEVLKNLVSKLNSFLDAVGTFKKELDKDGFSIDKITLLVPSFLALAKALGNIKDAKAELIDAFKDDDKLVELLKLALSIKNAIASLIDTFSKDPKAIALLLSTLESLAEASKDCGCACDECDCEKKD